MTESLQHAHPVALITGAARRLGRAMAEQLHERGYDLVVHYHHSADEAELLQEQLNAVRSHSVHILSADLAQTTEVRRLAARALQAFGRIDALINNASQFFPTPLGEANDEQWERLFNSNVRAPYILAQALADALRETNGCILNIVDIYAQRPLPNHSLYCASKAALASLTQSLAQELAPEVRVNAIAPGAILWPTFEPAGTTANTASAYQQAILDKTALGRCGTPQDIARTAWFLIAEAPYITGQILNVDGGRTLTI